jgi:hypothetical protein
MEEATYQQQHNKKTPVTTISGHKDVPKNNE